MVTGSGPSGNLAARGVASQDDPRTPRTAAACPPRIAELMMLLPIPLVILLLISAHRSGLRPVLAAAYGAFAADSGLVP